MDRLYAILEHGAERTRQRKPRRRAMRQTNRKGRKEIAPCGYVY